MLAYLWLIPFLPFLGFLLLVFSGRFMPRGLAAAIGVGSVGLSALVAVAVGVRFLLSPPDGGAFVQRLWAWVALPGFSIDATLRLDALALTMTGVITVVGFLIHLYSAEFMAHDQDFALFFAYMNLFVASMLVLVLADNLVFLYLGWEGVGLCSYLLIGFWYRDPENGRAARKAFIVTRIGDMSMLIGLALLAVHLGTLNIQGLMERAGAQWPAGSSLPLIACLLLLGGAIGKSAQVPLQTWLPDAMAGPTPTSALIHAATMVTAGVYLIARTNALYALAPAARMVVAIIGLVTLLVAGLSAIAQVDLKRVLAYSTVSQIGYMFLALGVGYYSAAIFHFVIHAFFKALLFLAAGAVIMAQEDEHNMFKMGGLRQVMPLTFWCFLIGASSLSALPLVTAGFYSKEWILWGVWQSGSAGGLDVAPRRGRGRPPHLDLFLPRRLRHLSRRAEDPRDPPARARDQDPARPSGCRLDCGRPAPDSAHDSEGGPLPAFHRRDVCGPGSGSRKRGRRRSGGANGGRRRGRGSRPGLGVRGRRG